MELELELDVDEAGGLSNDRPDSGPISVPAETCASVGRGVSMAFSEISVVVVNDDDAVVVGIEGNGIDGFDEEAKRDE